MTVRQEARVARKRAKAEAKRIEFIDFDYQNRTYQIDAEARRVYNRFVEVETSKASQILSVWRSQFASA